MNHAANSAPGAVPPNTNAGPAATVASPTLQTHPADVLLHQMQYQQQVMRLQQQYSWGDALAHQQAQAAAAAQAQAVLLQAATPQQQQQQQQAQHPLPLPLTTGAPSDQMVALYAQILHQQQQQQIQQAQQAAQAQTFYMQQQQQQFMQAHAQLRLQQQMSAHAQLLQQQQPTPMPLALPVQPMFVPWYPDTTTIQPAQSHLQGHLQSQQQQQVATISFPSSPPMPHPQQPHRHFRGSVSSNSNYSSPTIPSFGQHLHTTSSGISSPTHHPTPLLVQPFIGGLGSVLLVEGLDCIPMAPRTTDSSPVNAAFKSSAHRPMVQLNADHLFTLFGVYGDVVRVKLVASSASEAAFASCKPTTALSMAALSNAGMGGVMTSASPSAASSTFNSPSTTPLFGSGAFPFTSPVMTSGVFQPYPYSHASSLAPSCASSNAASPMGPTPNMGASPSHRPGSSVSPGLGVEQGGNILHNMGGSVALVQFMSKEQALLALQHLAGVRLLGPYSSPMRISVSPLAMIPFVASSPGGSERRRGSSPAMSTASIGSTLDNFGGVVVKDYSNHPGHRFKYMQSKNSRHVCGPCPALHASGLAGEITEEELRRFFDTALFKALGPAPLADGDEAGAVRSHVRSVALFGSAAADKRMAFIVFGSTDAAVLALLFGHNTKLNSTKSTTGGAGGRYMRLTFSHAKEHQAAAASSSSLPPTPTNMPRQLVAQHQHPAPTQPTPQQSSQEVILALQQQLSSLQLAMSTFAAAGAASQADVSPPAPLAPLHVAVSPTPTPPPVRTFVDPPALAPDVMGFAPLAQPLDRAAELMAEAQHNKTTPTSSSTSKHI